MVRRIYVRYIYMKPNWKGRELTATISEHDDRIINFYLNMHDRTVRHVKTSQRLGIKHFSHKINNTLRPIHYHVC